MAASTKDPTPRDFRTIDAAAGFWHRHSLADYAEHLKPAKIRGLVLHRKSERMRLERSRKRW